MFRIGIDIGATRIKAGLIKQGAVVRTLIKTLRPEDKSENGIIELVNATVKAILAETKVQKEEVEWVGIGAPGFVMADTGVIFRSPNFPLWKDFPLAKRAMERIGFKVFLDNDANCVTLGEAFYGAGKGQTDFVLMTLGSGVGGGLFLNGKLYRGADGMAGEIGHMVVEPRGYECGCGSRGCLEQYASFCGLRNMALETQIFGDKTKEMAKNPDLPRILYEMAKTGDSGARSLFARMGYYLGLAISNLVLVFNCHLVVLCGGIARALDMFEKDMRDCLQSRLPLSFLEGTRVVTGELWEEAGILGSSALGQERFC
jgi:glucokinase